MSQPVIEGTGDRADAWVGTADQGRRVLPRLPRRERRNAGPLPQPEILSRNGSYLAYRRMEEHVGAFRDFLRQQAETPEEQELLAAKLMGRWRSGAPLVLAPDQGRSGSSAAIRSGPTTSTTGKMDPHGYRCPIGAHIRRMNPRDTAENMNRRRMIRRGGTYGPPLPEGAADDGVERGIAAFVGCASLIRQFEFAHECLGQRSEVQRSGERARPDHRHSGRHVRHDDPQAPDPQDGSSGLPAFTTVRGGAYFFLPGIRALRFLASGQAEHVS